MLAAFVAGVWVGFKLSRGLGQAGKTKPQEVKKSYHDVKVQGPVRYTRKNAEPRFVAAGDQQ